ncbi:leucine-rich repeat extensin protein 3 [Spatholobus suberectus]|nr:leucine-rich repeat extensin protein 3 [Spatholobus suberectus]
MFPAKFLAVVVVALWLSESNFHGDALGDVTPTPPLSYGAPPPPSSDYSIYGSPPPPHKSGHSKCPPATGVQCCTPPAPYTYGYGYGPPNPYYAPPYPYYAPPNPYTYVPYGEAQGPASMILPILVPLMMLFSSFIFLV